MSVAMVPNWSLIHGTALAVSPAPGYDNFAAVQVKVQGVEPVAGFANLLDDASGRELSVLMPQNQAQRLGVAPGAVIRARVRRAGIDRVFAHPDEVTVEQSGA